MTTIVLGAVVYSYLVDHLDVQKGLRPTSIQSYRDAIRLFLNFVAEDAGRRITRLALGDLTFDRVLRFLKYLEDERHNHIRTRNQRLTVLHGFFDYIASRIPEMLEVAQRVAAIPTKRVALPEMHYLTREEIGSLFDGLPTRGYAAVRDRALLLFLYNTGARVQEVAELLVGSVELGLQPRVRLHGKGDKWRRCPLWAETARQLRELLEEQGTLERPEAPVFVSRSGGALTRSGIYKLVRRHASHLDTRRLHDVERTVTPHTFRHTTAVHLLESGVEANVIRGWLGHVSLETTNRYAEITIAAKEEALRRCEPPVKNSAGFPREPVWRNDKAMLAWLDSL